MALPAFVRRMRRASRIVGTVLLVAGLLGLAWTITVWRWQDPFTALYTHYEQGKLSQSLNHEFRAYRASHPVPKQTQAVDTRAQEERDVAAAAARFRRQ